MAAELGQTKDPRALIPGNPESLENSVRNLGTFTTTFENIGADLGKVRTDGWGGQANDVFWQQFGNEKKDWHFASDSMSGAGKALSGYAESLRSAQISAQSAIDLWEEGKSQTNQAVDAHNAQVDKANAGQGQAPPPFQDPGAGKRKEAEDLLNRARGQLKDAGSLAAAAIKKVDGSGPDAPSWLAKSAATAKDAIKEYGIGKTKIKTELDKLKPKNEWKKNNTSGWKKDKKENPDAKGAKTKWSVQLAELKGESNLWEAGAKGETDINGVKVKGDANVKIGVAGSLSAALTQDGFAAQAKATAGITASASGSMQYGILKAEAKADAMAGAEAEAGITAGKDGVNAKVGAFAGAKAGVSGGASVGGIGAGGTAEVRAGIGAEANAVVGKDKDGAWHIGFEVSATLGVGAKVGGQITIDPNEVIHTAEEAATAIGHAAQDVGRGIGNAAEATGHAISEGFHRLNPFD
ncbi:hypothetical protein D5S17_33785 [Pseudonocardiaceae bacterium YIM PH 21723]|nr:hypothetical protein D5S17_33785 [Pseudonocardiaceae bacterium YIM PH 21723]